MLSIVCPVYNEAENIEQTLLQIQKNISVSLEVVIVYDFDEDTTLPVIHKIAKNFPFEIRLVKNKFERGALNAIKTGFISSLYEAVLVVMADVSDDLSIVDRMYQLICDGYDIVCGSRYMPGGKQIGGPWFKKFLSRTAGISLYYITGIPTHDVTNSFKMYKKDLLDSLSLESIGGFEIGMEIVAKAFVQGKKITELPTTWTDRTAGSSRFQLWTWLPHYLKWYFYVFKRRKR